MCKLNLCYNFGFCVNIGYVFLCKCFNEYIGVVCDIKIRLCEKVFCWNNGDCINVGELVYICYCKLGFYGMNCDSKIIEICELNFCYNGGFCFIEGIDVFECFCDFDFIGWRCENKL